jgi:polyhydroxyalkanoate synthesis regulator phasin
MMIAGVALFVLLAVGCATLSITNALRTGFQIQVLTKEDMSLIASEQSPQLRSKLSSDAAARKDFARDVRRILAVAEEAVNKGFDRKPELQRQLEFQEANVISQYYFDEQGLEQDDIPQQEIDAFYKESGSQQKFDQIVSDAKSQDSDFQPSNDDIGKLRRRVAAIFITERKGRALRLHEKPQVKLQIMMEKARLLAQKYAAEELRSKLSATDVEIDTYLTSHPELDTSKQRRDQAEQVLRRSRDRSEESSSGAQRSRG